MSRPIVKVSHSEFRKFLERSKETSERVSGYGVVESDNRQFDRHMGQGPDDLDELLEHIEHFKEFDGTFTGSAASADKLYVLQPYDDRSGDWDKALDEIAPRHEDPEGGYRGWLDEVDARIPEVAAEDMGDFIYKDGKSSDFLIFTCDVVEIMNREWSTLHTISSNDPTVTAKPDD
jgi:hypothetical protein